jgi:hypothetical protein
MNTKSKQLKKMMAKKMLSYKRPHCHGKYTSKEGAKEWFKAKVDKKKLPPVPEERKKDPKYAKLSIRQFEKKHPW